MNNWRPLAILSALIVFGVAHAESMYSVEMACPIGGEKFTHLGTGSFQVFGSRPDGKTYQDWPDPMPMPVCPKNGLVVYADFSKSDLKKLKPIITSREYQSMRKTETEYYLVYWLKRQMGANVEDLTWTLLKSSWQADGNPELKKRYQSEFVVMASSIAKPERLAEQFEWLNLQTRAVNALRELGRFDEAVSLRDGLIEGTLKTFPDPPKDGNLEPRVDGMSKEEIELVGASVVRAHVTKYLSQLQVAIDRHDASSEPMDMVPTRVAASRCRNETTDDPFFNSVCNSKRVQQRMYSRDY